MSYFKSFVFIIFVVFPFLIYAETPPVPAEMTAKNQIIKAFRYFKNVSPNISVPKVVEVPFDESSFSIPSFAVYNLTTSTFEPSLLSAEQTETQVRMTASGEIDIPSNINDGNYSTYFEFPFEGNLALASTINFNFEKPITTSSLNFILDNNVALPQTISISAEVAGKEYIVLAPVRLTSGAIVFPKTTSAFWQVSFSYIQPLRISEMKFNDLSFNQNTKRGLRFLAQPGQSYQIYFDADRYANSTNKEAGDLFSSKGVVYSNTSNTMPNLLYQPVDSDSDSIPDLSDNCTSVANSDQKDGDHNGLGDACEDYDRDGVVNMIDNCADVPNYAQTDTDKDDLGDVCDNLDNRVTERMPWLPWVGIGVAGIVIFGLFSMVLMHKKDEN